MCACIYGYIKREKERERERERDEGNVAEVRGRLGSMCISKYVWERERERERDTERESVRERERELNGKYRLNQLLSTCHILLLVNFHATMNHLTHVRTHIHMGSNIDTLSHTHTHTYTHISEKRYP